MKLIAGISTLISLTLAGPSSRTGAPISPVWMRSETIPTASTGAFTNYYSLSEAKVPNAGDIAWTVCGEVGGFGAEPFCPSTAAAAEEVYTNLLAEHFMPLSVAAGEFDVSERDQVQPFAIGVKAYDNVPSTIDHTTLTQFDGSVNDVYKCGPLAWGGVSFSQFSAFDVPAATGPGWTDATAPDTKACLNLGGHQGFNDTFAPMTMTNMPCTTTMYVICMQSNIVDGSMSHNGLVTVVTKDMNTTNVEIVKQAFNSKYDGSYVEPTSPPIIDPVTEPAEETPNNMRRNIIIGVVVLVLIAVVAFVATKK